MTSNDLLSHVINLKYQYVLSLYRQETYFDMLSVSLSRQTLSNWIIGAAAELQPVYDIMKEQLLEGHYVQADETTVVVVDSKGARASATIYSVVERAKANGLVVEKYLVYLMDALSNLETKDNDTLLKYMPPLNKQFYYFICLSQGEHIIIINIIIFKSQLQSI